MLRNIEDNGQPMWKSEVNCLKEQNYIDLEGEEMSETPKKRGRSGDDTPNKLQMPKIQQ
jgi:hypothetical protein